MVGVKGAEARAGLWRMLSQMYDAQGKSLGDPGAGLLLIHPGCWAVGN